MKQNIRHLQRFFLICFLLLLLSLVYWQVISAKGLLARDDNPRPVIAEQRIRRGPIFSRQGRLLAKTSVADNGLVQRTYPHPAVAPVVGYYSLRYGTGGLEAAYNTHLRGETQLQDPRSAWLATLLHQPPQGEALTTTLHLPAQLAADAALNQAGATGAVIVLQANSGQVLVLASRPAFNPNDLESEWDILVEDPNAPLLNRATQGLFPLGELIHLVALIGLYETGSTLSTESPWSAWPDLLTHLNEVNDALLTITARRLLLDRELAFILPTATPAWPANWPDKAPELAVTPLHIAMIGAALAVEGLAPTPVLVSNGETAYSAPQTRLMAAKTADAMCETWDIWNNLGNLDKTWDNLDNWDMQLEVSALAVPEITGNDPLSWYLGLTGTQPPLVVVAVVTAPAAQRTLAKGVARSTLRAIE